MPPFQAFRSGCRRFLVNFVLATLLTGCSYESWRGEHGSGYNIGIAVEPTVLIMTVIGVGLMSYWLWRGMKKR